jgi:hypothetical protein
MVIFVTIMDIRMPMFGLNMRTGIWREVKQDLEPTKVLKTVGNSLQHCTTKASLHGANACVS